MRLLTILLLIFSGAAWSQSGKLPWPTEGKVVRKYDASSKGIDIAGKLGQAIFSVSGGTVLYSGFMRGYGNLIIIDHHDGLVSAYAHNKTNLVAEGQTVSKGQLIAEMGESDARSVKLHFEIRSAGKAVDPLLYLFETPQADKEDDRAALALGIVFWRSGVADVPGKITREWENKSGATHVTFSPDGRLLLVNYHNKSATLIEAKTGKVLSSWNQDHRARSVQFSPDGLQVLTGTDGKTVTLREGGTGRIRHSWQFDVEVRSVQFSPDGKTILIATTYEAILIDGNAGQVLHTFPHRHWVRPMFSPDGQKLLTAPNVETAILSNVLTGQLLHTWSHQGKLFDAIAFSPDGKQTVIGVAGGVFLRDTATGQILQNWRFAASNRFSSLAFSPDGRQILAALKFDTKEVLLLDAQSGKTLNFWKYEDVNQRVSFSRDGRYFLRCGTHGSTIQNISDGGVHLKMENHQPDVDYDSGSYPCTFSPDGSQVLTRGDTRNIRQTGLRVSLQDAFNITLDEAGAEHRSLPKALADRQSRLEAEKPVKDEFETLVQFNARVAQWNKAATELNAAIKAHYANLGPLPLDKRAKAFERALSIAYGNPELRDISYDPETQRFFASLRASLDPEFKRSVSIPLPREQARAAKAQLESDKNGLVVELRLTEQNELIWGQPRVRIDNKLVVAQFVDKDFVPPHAMALSEDSRVNIIAPPSLPNLPQSADVKVIEDPTLSKLQMEVLQKEREQAALAARLAEEKRLKDRLAELNRQNLTSFNDDLPALIAKLPVAKPNPRLHVLAIGINDYADVPDVPFADRSAQGFAEIAQKLLGAQPQNVIVLTDGQATLGRLLSRINTLLNRLGPQDQLLFYYAGHGVPSKDGAGAYLLAQDGGPGSYEQPDLQLGHIYSVIAKSRVGQAKIFIDACFSGRSGKDAIVFEGIAPIVVKPKQSFPDADHIAVITAGRGDQFSNQDKSRGHRLFSYHLMRLILEDGAKLEMRQLHQRLRQRVLEESRRIGPEFEQEPDLQGNGRMVLLN